MDEPTPGLKAVLNFTVPDQKSGKVNEESEIKPIDCTIVFSLYSNSKFLLTA